MAQVLNFEIRRGDTPVIQGFLRDELGNPINDPSAQYRLAARKTMDATGPALFTVGPTAQFAPGEGRCPIPIGATSGLTYDQVLFYDLDVTESNGNVTTLVTGKILVRMDQAH